jgi:hypothetical protein
VAGRNIQQQNAERSALQKLSCDLGTELSKEEPARFLIERWTDQPTYSRNVGLAVHLADVPELLETVFGVVTVHPAGAGAAERQVVRIDIGPLRYSPSLRPMCCCPG